MKKIVILGQRSETIPAVNGGAVATLMQMLAEENEICNMMDLTFICRYDERAYLESKKYSKTKFIFLDENIFEKIIHRLLKIANRFIPPLSRYMKSSYLWQAYGILKKMENVDWLVVEEDMQLTGYWKFQKLPMKIAYHSHLHEVPMTKPLYDRILTVSDFCRNPWKKYMEEEKVVTCYNCIHLNKFAKNIDIEELKKMRHKYGYKENDFLILYVGRIKDVKGVKELVESVLGIENDNVRLLLIGSSGFGKSIMTEYEKEIDKLVCLNKGRVKHISYISNDKLPIFYQMADIQCIPSLCEEAAGLVAIEGMASGLPLIVTKSGGMVEYVSEKCASIIPREGDFVKNLRDEIIKIAQDNEKRKRMSEEGRKRSKRFSQSQYYENFIKALEN